MYPGQINQSCSQLSFDQRALLLTEVWGPPFATAFLIWTKTWRPGRFSPEKETEKATICANMPLYYNADLSVLNTAAKEL